jgi:hypothetical protein
MFWQVLPGIIAIAHPRQHIPWHEVEGAETVAPRVEHVTTVVLPKKLPSQLTAQLLPNGMVSLVQLPRFWPTRSDNVHGASATRKHIEVEENREAMATAKAQD